MWERNQKKFRILAFGLVVMLASCVSPSIYWTVSYTPTVTFTLTSTEEASSMPVIIQSPTLTTTLTPTPVLLSLQGTSIPLPDDVIAINNSNQVTLLARWSNGIANQIEHSPNGKYLAIASTVGIFLYETKTYSQVGSFEDYPHGVDDIKFSPDSKSLAVVSGETYLEFLSIPDGNKISEFDDAVQTVAFSPDGEKTAIAVCEGEYCATPIIKIFNREMKMLFSFEENGRPSTLEFSPDGKLLGVQTIHVASIWDLESAENIFQFGPNPIQHTPYDLVFSPNGKQFAISTSSDVRLYSTSNLKLLNTLKVSNEGRQYFCVEFSPDSNSLAVGGSTVYLWQVSDGVLISTFDRDPKIYPGVITDLSWSQDSNRIVTATNFEPQPNHYGVIIWNVSKGEVEKHIEGFSSAKSTLTWMSNGNMLAVSSLGYNTLVQVLSTIDGTPKYNFSENLSVIYSYNLSFSPNSSNPSQVAGDYVYFRNVVDAFSGEEFSFAYSPFPIKFSPDGHFFAISDFLYSDNNRIERISILDTKNGEVFQSWDIDNDMYIYDLEFDSSGKYLYALQINRDVYLGSVLRLNVDSGNLETLDITPSKHVRHISVSPDGKSIVLVSLSGNIDFIHEMGSTVVLSDLDANNIEWSPNGDLMIVPSNNGIIYILDAKDGTVISSLYGHTLGVNDAKFSPDGTLIASTSSDGTIRIWGIP